MARFGHKDTYSNSVKKSDTRYIRIEFGKLSVNHQYMNQLYGK